MYSDDKKQHKYIRKKYGDRYSKRKLIKIHNFTGKRNEMRARHFATELENGNVKFPAPTGISSKEEERIMNEFKKAWSEIVSIQPQMGGKYVKYEPYSSSMKKDRWTTIELGTYMADEYIKRMGSKTADSSLSLGIWA